MAKILLIEDDPDNQRTMCEFLMRKGHKVSTASNGAEGLKILDQDPDIILCDFRMPEMDGYEFTCKIRTDPSYAKYSQKPIIGTGDFPTNQRMHLTDGKCFTKPHNIDKLLRCICQYSPTTQ